MSFGKFYEGFLGSNQIEVWFEEEEVLWVADDDGLSRPLSANKQVGVYNAGCFCFSQEKANGSGIGAVEFCEICVRLANESVETSLPGWVSQCLGEGGGRNRDSHAHLFGSS